MRTFLDKFHAGQVSVDDIDDDIDRWHAGERADLELHEYLGLTWPEYGRWVMTAVLPSPETREEPMAVETLQGGEKIWAHSPAACSGPPCAVHWPSQHHMRSWRQHWRGDRKMIERVCPNPEHGGTGHPDPDDLARDRVHGCCGCCTAPPPAEEESA